MNASISESNDKEQAKAVPRLKNIIPNLFSLSRVLISPLVFIAVKNSDIDIIIILAVWAMISDFIDGRLARHWGVISETGKILDPLGDKLCIAAAAIALSLYGDFPPLLAIIIVGRDIFILFFGLALAGKIKRIPGSNLIGKITATVLAVVLLIHIFKLTGLYDIALVAALFFIVLSSVSYLISALRFIFNKT